MLKTIDLINIFSGNNDSFFRILDLKKSKELQLFEMESISNNVKVFVIIFHQFYAFLLNKGID